RFLGYGVARNRVAGDDVNTDVPGTAHEIVDDRTVQNLEPPGPRRFADNDLRHVVGLRVSDDVVSDAAVACRQSDRLAAQRLCEPERVGEAGPLFLRGV